MALDEALDLRQPRDAGVPVGPRGEAASLRRLAQAYGLRPRGGMAMDASPFATLSFDALYPRPAASLGGQRRDARRAGA